jgi:hypothetical protein
MLREINHRPDSLSGEQMSQKVFITMTGISRWPVINSLWAAVCCKGYVPDRIYLFVTRGREQDAHALAEWINLLLEAHGKKAELIRKEIEEGDFMSSGKRITAIMEEERSAGNEVAIDITPGRKAIISSALLSAWQKQVDHVFYLYLEDMRNAANPYPMIPFHLQHFVDLKEEVWK